MPNTIDRKTVADKYDALSISNSFLNVAADLVVVTVLTTPALAKKPLALIISTLIIIASIFATVQDNRFSNLIEASTNKAFGHWFLKPIISIVMVAFVACCIVGFIYTGHSLSKTTSLILWEVFLFETITTVLNAVLFSLTKLLSR
ncbi:hypothetical protein QUW45_07550 [Limosilactobacillus pontis]|uniref:hypothetical protein n=1 Tax=Limosilactobacillus pontis TaxID=35787 RepID=UPI0025A33401|nr:hypothetical protein [Limosilactobacillus pontis]MDM8332516.1 hypothetical protein [Limosilactobacillus pontis]